MTADEIRQKLKDAGIPTDGSWAGTEEKVVRSPLLDNQKVLLEKLSELMELQVQKDQAQVADLLIAVERVRHGGGS